MYDAIIIGSGLSGVAAALKLKPMKTLMLDSGVLSPAPLFSKKNIYQERRNGKDLFEGLIGKSYELFEGSDDYISPKLKGPQMRYLWKKVKQAPHDKLINFDAIISYARGGLANAWGAGVLRYTNRDLQEFPFNAEDLDCYYDELTDHIGIAGERDDLEPFFGSAKGLLPSLPLSPIAETVFKKYYKKKSTQNKKNIFIGRPRLAVLSEEYHHRPAYQSLLQDFFQGDNLSVYHPTITLKELCKEKTFEYKAGFLITQFSEERDKVKVVAKNLLTNSLEIFYAKKIFIGAGAINTARIVLQSFNDYTTRLPLLDNPVGFVPFLDLSKVGRSFPENVFPGAELMIVYDGENYSEPIQASVYGLYGPMRSDLMAELPFAFRSNISAVKYLGGAMGMLQVFFPDKMCSDNYLQLQHTGGLTINHKIVNRKKYLDRHENYTVRPFLNMLRSMNYVACSSLCKFPVAGSSIHYAGSLPMRQDVQHSYETDRDGKLSKTRSIYIIDAANFPYLPSKNHSFTMMANAMRIADKAKNNI